MKRLLVAAAVLACLGFARPARADSDAYFLQIASVTSSAVVVATGAAHAPLKFFSLQVVGRGAAPSSWVVNLEGSLDGLYYTKIMEHASGDGDANASVKSSTTPASGIFPVSYIRANVKSLSLGSATGIAVTAIGIQ